MLSTCIRKHHKPICGPVGHPEGILHQIAGVLCQDAAQNTPPARRLAGHHAVACKCRCSCRGDHPTAHLASSMLMPGVVHQCACTADCSGELQGGHAGSPPVAVPLVMVLCAHVGNMGMRSACTGAGAGRVLRCHHGRSRRAAGWPRHRVRCIPRRQTAVL
jgi:hypothetical protein